MMPNLFVIFTLNIIFLVVIENQKFCQLYGTNDNRVELIGTDTKINNRFFITIGENYWFIDYKNQSKELGDSWGLNFLSEDKEASGSSKLLSNGYSMTILLRDEGNQTILNGFFKVKDNSVDIFNIEGNDDELTNCTMYVDGKRFEFNKTYDSVIGFDFTNPPYSVVIEQKKLINGSDGNKSVFKRDFKAFQRLVLERNNKQINASKLNEEEWTKVRDIEDLDESIQLIGVLPLNYLTNEQQWYKTETIIIIKNESRIQYCLLQECLNRIYGTLIDCQTDRNETTIGPTDQNFQYNWIIILMLLMLAIGSVLIVVIYTLCWCQKATQHSNSHKKQSKRVRSESQTDLNSKSGSPREGSNETKSVSKSDSKSDGERDKSKNILESPTQSRTESSASIGSQSIRSLI